MTTNGYRLSELDSLMDAVFSPTYRVQAYPPVDVVEHEDRYTLHAELPGRTMEGIDVRTEDSLLTISSTDASAEPGAPKRRAFRRSFAIPRNVDPTAIAARYRDGILSIDLPKRPDARPRSIEIE